MAISMITGGATFGDLASCGIPQWFLQRFLLLSRSEFNSGSQGFFRALDAESSLGFATPLREAREVQCLIDAGRSCLFLPDAYKMLVVVADD